MILSFIQLRNNNVAVTQAIESEPLCPIPSKVAIQEHDKVQFILHDEEYRSKSAELLSKAVQVDTIVFDEMTMDDYAKMGKFHEYLETNFPLVYSKAHVTKVNEYGLVFEFPGEDTDLKPILLLAHQDTVPIGDAGDWVEDPLSGRYDGERVYGRGSTDCKTLLVSLMESMEMIIEDGKGDGFKRGLIMAFGFDEEKSGFDGAYHIGQWLLEKYGSDSIDHIIDEGPMMFMEQFGDYYALVPTGEKGYIDLQIDITTPGGHSSNPKMHTSIGMMSKLLVAYEEDAFDSFMALDNPMLGMFECVAEQGRLPAPIAKAAKGARYDKKSNEQLSQFVSEQGILKWLITTTQAIDIIDGGDKANALPRAVRAIINHRINYGEDENTIWAKSKRHGLWIAKKYGLGLVVNGEVMLPETPMGNLVFSAMKEGLKPAKATPLYDEVYNKFTGTIKAFYEDEVFPELFEDSDKKFIIAPAIMTGNTDTRHYWDLTDSIFRVQPGSMDFMNANIHGPNEFSEVDSHLQQVAFYYNYILANV